MRIDKSFNSTKKKKKYSLDSTTWNPKYKGPSTQYPISKYAVPFPNYAIYAFQSQDRSNRDRIIQAHPWEELSFHLVF